MGNQRTAFSAEQHEAADMANGPQSPSSCDASASASLAMATADSGDAASASPVAAEASKPVSPPGSPRGHDVSRPKALSRANSIGSPTASARADERWTDRRRAQSETNLPAHSEQTGATGTQTTAGSPTNSEPSLSSLRGKGIAGAAHAPPTVITVTTSTADAGKSTASGLLAMSSSFLSGLASPSHRTTNAATVDSVETVKVLYETRGPLFVDLFSRDDGTGAHVKSFRRKPDGSMASAEACGRVFPNDELFAINGVVVTSMVFADIITAAQTAEFPLTLTFRCHQKNRDAFEQQQQQQPQRKFSSGPLPPVSPSHSGTSTWSAKLTQMTRSGSFDVKSDGASSVPRSPTASTASANTPTGPNKFRAPWGDGISLDKVRNSGTDGMKNLFRIMGAGNKSRPEEDKDTVRDWMSNLALKPHSSAGGGRNRKTAAAKAAEASEILHSTPIMAVTTGGRFVGVLDEDDQEFALSWYRKTPPENDLAQIKGVRRCPYFPSVDDVGAILSLQCESLRFPQFTRVVELPGPLVLDPAVGNMVEVLLEAGAGSFSATLASNEHDSFQVKISAESVALVKISEQEDEAGVVADAAYGQFLQVLLDPTDQLRFTLKVQELGGFLGNRDGDVCDLKHKQTQLASLSCFFLVAQNRQHRDILTLLIRKFRARVLEPEQETQAQRDERNLFMDPAFVVAAAVASPSSGVTQPSTGGPPSAASSPAGASVVAESADFSPDGASSPNSVSTPRQSGSASSGGSAARPGRLLSDGSSSSLSARFGDMFGFDLEDSAEPTVSGAEGSGATTPAATPPRSGIAVRSGLGQVSTNSMEAPMADGFVQGRLAAQEKEIAMLRDKLASLSVLLKATDQEKSHIAESIEVKDKRIELQQLKLRQLEKLTSHCNTQTRELQSVRAKLEDEEKRHAVCREELQEAVSAAAKRAAEIRDQGCQTEDQFFADGDDMDTTDSWFSGTTTVTADDLQQQIKAQQEEIAKLKDEQVDVVAERNSFRAKATELARELRKLVGANQNRSLADIEAQLAERSELKAQLAIARAEVRRAADEMNEYKGVLDGLGDKDKGARRLASQNLELQRSVHQLEDALSETTDQLSAMKKINSALASRLQQLHPDSRGSFVESPSASPREGPMMSSDGGTSEQESDDSDDSEEEEDKELQDGIAAFRRSLVGKEAKASRHLL